MYAKYRDYSVSISLILIVLICCCSYCIKFSSHRLKMKWFHLELRKETSFAHKSRVAKFQIFLHRENSDVRFNPFEIVNFFHFWPFFYTNISMRSLTFCSSTQRTFPWCSDILDKQNPLISSVFWECIEKFVTIPDWEKLNEVFEYFKKARAKADFCWQLRKISFAAILSPTQSGICIFGSALIPSQCWDTNATVWAAQNLILECQETLE